MLYRDGRRSLPALLWLFYARGKFILSIHTSGWVTASRCWTLLAFLYLYYGSSYCWIVRVDALLLHFKKWSRAHLVDLFVCTLDCIYINCVVWSQLSGSRVAGADHGGGRRIEGGCECLFVEWAGREFSTAGCALLSGMQGEKKRKILWEYYCFEQWMKN